MIGYTPDADRDVTRLHDGLEAFSVRAAEAFMAQMRLAEQRIEKRPLAYRRLRDMKTRRYAFKINRVSYLIDYRVDLSRIVVLRVWHGRQDRTE